MSSFWNKHRVLVTGGTGFLGSFIVERIQLLGCEHLYVPRRAEFDLRDQTAVIKLYKKIRPSVVIHLAASVGGIGANQRHPGKFFYENAIMGLQVIEQARIFGVEKLICVGTVCSYPKSTPVPFSEMSLWDGYPEDTNAPYGLAKKMLLVQLAGYRQEYGFNSVYVIPSNLYGPRDNFDLESSHVIPGIIRKCVEAKRDKAAIITAWGTGMATRDFLFVEDAAEAILLAAEKYNKTLPLNLGGGVGEIRICDLVSLIAKLVGYAGIIEWDSSRPDGQPRRWVDTQFVERELGWRAKTQLSDGLRRTIEWFTKGLAVTSHDTPTAHRVSV